MYTKQLFEVCSGNHVMLVYEDNKARLDAAAFFINEGIKRGELCIYASVHSFDNTSELSVSNLSTMITDYESNMENENLQFIDFKPFYESAVASNLSPFLLLKEQLEETLHRRATNGKGDKVMVYADAACCLTENEQFAESAELERWWQGSHNQWISNDTRITVVCPHPAQVLRRELETKWNIADAHDVMIFLNSHILGTSRKNVPRNNLRILIAESEPDIMTLYSDYLSALGHDVSVVTDGNKCISLFKKRDFDLVIVDTHLNDHLSVNDIGEEITRIEPHQRIIITTTESPTHLLHKITNSRTQNHEILQKPFHLSKLAGTIMHKSETN